MGIRRGIFFLLSRKKGKNEEATGRQYRVYSPTWSSSVAESMGGRSARGWGDEEGTTVDQVYVREEGAREEAWLMDLTVSRSEIWSSLSVFALALARRLMDESIDKRGGEEKQGTRQLLYHTHIQSVQLDNVQALCHCPSGANDGNRWAAIRGNHWG